MSETIAGRPAAPPENPFEASARAMSEFVIRAAILPVTLLFSKPKDLAAGAASGDYKLLPSPFLLASITGVVVSGVTSNLDKFEIPRPDQSASESPNFLKAVIDFYMNMDGVQAILFALPYIFVLWGFAALLSLCIRRNIDESQTLFAPLSWSMAAIVAITVLGVVASFLIDIDQDAVGAVIFFGSLAFGLIVAIKLVRLVLVLRKERGYGLIGAILACVVGLFIVTLAGTVGAAMSASVFQQRVMVREIYAAEADGRRSEALARASAFEAAKDYTNAISEYSKAIDADPGFAGAYRGRSAAHLRLRQYPEALLDVDRALALEPQNPTYLNTRCWTRAVWGQELDRAVADCDEALRLRPGSSRTLDSRALAHLRADKLDAALADYDAAVAADPKYGHALYGRGVVRMRLGRTAEGEADMAAAVALDANAASDFASYGLAVEAAAASPAPEPSADEAQPKAR